MHGICFLVMQKKFILNLILLLFLNLLIKPFYVFFIDVNVQRMVGLNDYGIYLSIFNFTYVINIFLDMGITNFNNRNIAQNSHLLSKYFPTIIVLRLLLFMLYVAIAFVLALAMDYDIRQMKLLGVLVFNQFLLSFILYLRSNISGLLHFVTDSFISVLDRVLLIVFCLILFYARFFEGRFSVEWFVYAQTASYVITALVALSVVIKDSGFSKPKFNRPLLLLILKKSFPFALLTLLMACYNRIDTVLIKQMLPGDEGSMQVGIYGHSFRILEAFNNFSYLFAVLLLPIYARMLKNNDNVNGITKTAFGLLLCFSFTLSTLCMFYGLQIMDLMYDVEIEYSAQVFKVLIYCFPSMSLAYIFGTLLTANGSLKVLNIISLLGMGISVVLNVALIPKHGALGSAYAGVITQMFVVLCQMVMSRKLLHLSYDRHLMKYASCAVLYVLSLFVAGYFISDLDLNWMWCCGLHLLAGVALAVLFNVFDVKGMLKLIINK